MLEIKQIVEEAIPLTPDCEIKRTAEFERRAQLRIRIEELLRDKSKPYQPPMEYKGSGFSEIQPSNGDITIK